jgi:CRISPR/Cas system CSM-associated protein Csm3 (group 7 of RAMP superfamily)
MQTKKLKIELKTKSPFRIGGKRDPFSKADQPIAKIGNKIIVQGTSLKGALRHEIEKYLIENYKDTEWMKPCIPSSSKLISNDEQELINKGKYKGESCSYSRENDYICPVCYFLGAQGLVGYVITPFLNADVVPSDLYSIRVDRAKGIAAKGSNREYQIIPEGIKFEGVMIVLLKDNIKDWELGKPRPLKESTLGDKWLYNSRIKSHDIIQEFIRDRLENIEVLGGLKSSGAGKVKIKTS